MPKGFKLNPLKWLGYLFAPIQKNGAFFVFMFALGWICTQLEINHHLKNAKPYEPEKKEDGVRREERTFGGKCKAYCGNIKPKLKEMKPTKAKRLNNI